MRDSGAYDCETCPIKTRAHRRCPKVREDDDLAALKIAFTSLQREPDENHAAACMILKVERHPEVLKAFEEHQDYLRGYMPRPDGLLNQPHRWLLLQQTFETESAQVRKEDREREKKKRGRR